MTWRSVDSSFKLPPAAAAAASMPVALNVLMKLCGGSLLLSRLMEIWRPSSVMGADCAHDERQEAWETRASMHFSSLKKQKRAPSQD